MNGAYANLNEDGSITVHGLPATYVSTAPAAHAASAASKKTVAVEEARELSKRTGAVVHWRPEHLRPAVDVAEVTESSRR
jgi:hypothetical protein